MFKTFTSGVSKSLSFGWKSLNLKNKTPGTVNKYIHIRASCSLLGDEYNFRAQLMKKGIFCLLTPSKQILFLIISNGNMFFKTQDSRFLAIFACSKDLE